MHGYLKTTFLLSAPLRGDIPHGRAPACCCFLRIQLLAALLLCLLLLAPLSMGRMGCAACCAQWCSSVAVAASYALKARKSAIPKPRPGTMLRLSTLSRG